MFFSAITTFDRIQGASANEVINNKSSYSLIFIRNDTNAFTLIERGSKVIDCQSVDPCTDNTDDHHAEVVDEESRAADHDTSDSHGCADIEMQVFIHDLAENVQAACRSVDAEHKRLADGEQEDETDEVKPHIAHAQTATHHTLTNTHEHFARTA